MKKFIVITSVNRPTKAIEQFSKIDDWQLIVVGDKKTPTDWEHPNVTYISPDMQNDIAQEFSTFLPWNHYSRKMFGYLYAIKNGAEIIADSDDDNIPLEDWGGNINFQGIYQTIKNNDYLNIYKYFTEEKIWPRGFPLLKILNEQKPTIKKQPSNIGIWQGLADREPDVDAIYRLTNNQEIIFKKNKSIVLEKNTICPFNSQNTFFKKELFPLLYLPAFVTFRFTDILRGLIAQPVMWAANYNLGFTSATVYQERNKHNFLNDFESEIPMYLQTEKVINTIKEAINKSNTIIENLKTSYLALYKNNIVTKQEVELLSKWLNFFEN